jgi:eukaryotic-like serine/threonine-protein kinase
MSKGSSKRDSLIGQVLFEEYLVLERIGEGNMAVVYKAENKKQNRLVALKTLKDKNEELTARFTREVITHSMLRHKHIVEAIDCLTLPTGEAFFIMEYLDGDTLEEIIRDQIEPLPKHELVSIVLQICEGLQHAHNQKVIHRDLKPGNIIVEKKKNRTNAKIVDFGLAKVQNESRRLTVDGITLGSPLYMSPEQCLGVDLTPSSDVYSLGIVIYELVTGTLPFVGKNAIEIMSAHCDANVVPAPMIDLGVELEGLAELEKILNKAMETVTERRYQTVDQFQWDIRHWAGRKSYG